MGKTIKIKQDSLITLKENLNEFMVDKNSKVANHDYVWFILFRGDLLFFDYQNKQLLDDFLYRHNDELQNFIYYYEKKKYTYAERNFDNFVDWLGNQVPYLITGYISRGRDVYVNRNENYDVLNSNEFYQLVKKMPNSNFFIDSERIDTDEILDNKGQKTPDFWYHGTTFENALNIIMSGLKPQPDNSVYKIKHDKTVFISSNFKQAKWYANYKSRMSYGTWRNSPCVLKIDSTKLDETKIVYDYDVYNLHKIDRNDSVYNDRMKEFNLDYDNRSQTIGDTKDPRKYMKVGYRGVIMPNAVVSVYTVSYDGDLEMSKENFIKYVEEKRAKSEVKENVEADVYEIGQESDNPPLGGNACHVEESIEEGGYGCTISNYDMSEVGMVQCEDWTYDEEEYQEWLVDNELQDTLENKIAYIEDYNVEFDISLFDNQTYHLMGGDWAYYDDLVEVFGERMAKQIETEMLQDGQSKFETSDLYSDTEYDINNPQELNDIAMKLLPHGEYYQNCRGFILTNGVIVYTEGEHNDVLRIPGINSKFQFIELGNIRILDHAVDIGAEPTWEQEKVLRQVIASYDGEEFYLDIYSDGGEIGAQYPNADYQYIMGEIDRFYSEGIRPQGGYAYESKKGEKTMNENVDLEVDASDIDLSSFKKRSELAPIWLDDDTLDSRVRLRLLDIADDFWEFVNLTWVKPSGIVLTGSICNFNWSKYSDIDLHLIVDFDEIDEKTEFVQDYLDAKKNEWNNEHSDLTILGFPVELYVQNLESMPKSGGIYDLEENAWIKKPNASDIKPIGLDKFSIKDKAAEIMTIIDDMYNTLNSEGDSHRIEEIGEDAHYLWKKIKEMRRTSLEKNGESGAGNIVYKILRRMNYLDKLWKLSLTVYDRSNSITEGVNHDDIFELAKKHFGVTRDIRECGYVLPDGSMLDFSGRHTLNAGTDSSHLRGRRGVDHREIYEIGWDKTGNVKNFDIKMEDFIRAGAVRVHVSSKYCSLNLYQKPTNYQIPVLISIIQYAKGCVDVEIGDGNESLSYAEYDGVKARKPIANILRYFDEGINLVNESKEVLNEYLDKNYNLPLYKYFKWASTASDVEKVEDIIYACSYGAKNYIERKATMSTEFEMLAEKLEEDEDIIFNDDDFVEEIANAIVNNNLTENFIYYIETTYGESELPSWVFMDFNRIVKNEWCIHFGPDSDAIAKEGFTRGTEEIERLAYTGAGQQKRSAGYDFAFPLGERDIDYNNYGNEAVIFQTSGIEIYHHGDSQNQVIFWGPEAKNFIPIKYDGEVGDWCIYGKNGQVLKSGDPSDILDWAINNLPQYRKQIMAGKNGYIPMMSRWNSETNKYERKPYPIYRNESVKKLLTLLKEETVADGSSTTNPYKQRWKAEREALKNFVANYGKLMQSKEDDKGGKLYKVFYDKTMSNLIGYNYCICVQWDEIQLKPKSTVYIRALDKFTPFIRRNLQYDNRGMDNVRGTMDDTRTPNYGAYGA